MHAVAASTQGKTCVLWTLLDWQIVGLELGDDGGRSSL